MHRLSSDLYLLFHAGSPSPCNAPIRSILTFLALVFRDSPYGIRGCSRCKEIPQTERETGKPGTAIRRRIFLSRGCPFRTEGCPMTHVCVYRSYSRKSSTVETFLGKRISRHGITRTYRRSEQETPRLKARNDDIARLRSLLKRYRC